MTVAWRRGVVDRIRSTLESIQSKLPGTSDAAPSPATGPLYELRQPDGTVVDRVGGPKDPWLGVSGSVPAEGDDLTFLLGGPDRDSGGPKVYASDFAAAPEPASPAGGRARARALDHLHGAGDLVDVLDRRAAVFGVALAHQAAAPSSGWPSSSRS